MKTEFAQRPVVIIDATEADVEVMHPQLAILMIDNAAAVGKRYLDMGALCYKRRSRPNAHQVGSPVDLSSLDNARIPVVQALIELLRKKVSRATVASEFDGISKFIQWFDAQQQPYAFDDLALMK
ncbi:MAG: hypothetical protein ACTIJ4_14275, partial [Halomonas sp.]|uniref:hypothetical protein n=1 Tax=Halomonas sp. TaxID=1486246 RepID=UPI003F9E3EF5